MSYVADGVVCPTCGMKTSHLDRHKEKAAEKGWHKKGFRPFDALQAAKVKAAKAQPVKGAE